MRHFLKRATSAEDEPGKKQSFGSHFRYAAMGACIAVFAQQTADRWQLRSEEYRAVVVVDDLISMSAADSQPKVARAITRFAQALALVEEMHVSSTLEDDTVSVMLAGAMGSLDPHSGFMDDEYATTLLSDEDEDHRKQLGILGANLEGSYRIEALSPGGPAEISGVRPGDEIVSVDGVSVVGQSAQAINGMLFDKLQAPEISEVVLGLQRADMGTLISVTIVPDDIEPNQVFDLGVTDGVLHLGLQRFFPGLSTQVSNLIERAQAQRGITGVVLDLRDNGGGLTDEAMGVGELFLAPGTPLYQMSGRGSDIEVVHTSKKPEFPDLGVSVIINGNSASASEIIASAMQASERGKVVGWTSYGKGTVQRIFPVDGGAIKITIAEYLDAKGRTINEVGVLPDVMVETPDPLIRASRFEKDPAREMALRLAGGKHATAVK